MFRGLFNIFEEFMKVEYSKAMWTDMFNMTAEKLIPGVDDQVIAAYDKYIKHGLDIIKKAWTYEGKYPLLTHGDCWSNNMMFKYDVVMTLFYKFNFPLIIIIILGQWKRSRYKTFRLATC